MGKVIVMSGVSGSGKSTYAHKLALFLHFSGSCVCSPGDPCGRCCGQEASQRRNALVCPERSVGHYGWVVGADDFFEGSEGYRFDKTKLAEAHGQCFRRFIDLLDVGVDLVIVDNTNTTTEEIAPYMLGASAYGYEAEVITIEVKLKIGKVWLDDFAHRRSIHACPADTILRQMRNIADRRMLPWWKHTVMPSDYTA